MPTTPSLTPKQRWTHLALVLVLLLSEAVVAGNVFTYYSYHEQHAFAPFLLAVVFSLLLAGSTVIVARPNLPTLVRFILIGGITLLFSCQAVAGISMAYVTAASNPVFQVLERFW